MRHSLGLLLAISLPFASIRAQRAADAPPRSCQDARAHLRAELAREARERAPGRWSAEPASQTSGGNTITRAQRLLYDRAIASLRSAVTLLDSLAPVHGGLDDATLDEARPLLRARLREVALELERNDGPRFDAVDGGLKTASALVMRLGLMLCRGAASSDAAEARTVDAYVRVEEIVRMVRRDWIGAGMPRMPIPVAAGPDLTAPLTAAPPASTPENVAGITDTLDAVTQSLEELQAALEGMQLAPEQRDSIAVVGPGARRVSLGELLIRVERFATDDALRWLEGGGAADALPLLTATSDTLRQVARSFRLATETPGEDGSGDAQTALDRLAERLDVLYRLLATPTTR